MRRPSLVVCFVAVGALLASGCDWPQFGYGPAHTMSSPDSSISASAVVANSLALRWRADTTTARYGSVEAVADGVAYAGRDTSATLGFDSLAAFDAAGAANCSGTPATCEPLWTTPVAPGGDPASTAVASGTAVTTVGGLQAFDATGTTGCSGVPKVCQPLWRAAPLLGLDTPPTVASGRVYSGYRTFQELPFTAGLAVFDLSGQQGCGGSPVTCAPLWTGRVDTLSSSVGRPSVAGGVAYLVSGSFLYAFDAAGTTGCSGSPLVCAPLWRAAIDGGAQPGAPVVANGTVFVGSAGLAQVVGFDAAGTARCGGTPKTCLPIWIAKKADAAVPTVANGKVYLSGTAGALSVFDATGQSGCTGGGLRRCTPLWTYAPHTRTCNKGGCDRTAPTAVAGGVLYQAFESGFLVGHGDVTAYDATGTTGCSGTPKVCAPLRSWTTGALGNPIVSDGSLFLTTEDGDAPTARGIQVLSIP